MELLINFFKSFWRNIGTIFTALILATFVWVSAVIAEDPNVTKEFAEGIPIDYDETLDNDLIISNQIPKNAQITLSAPESIWEELEAGQREIYAKLNLNNLNSGEHIIELEIIGFEDLPVRILSIEPEKITVELERLAQREFEIKPTFVGEPALGYQNLGLDISDEIVIISGPEPLVENVSEVVITIDIGGAREPIITELEVIPIDFDGNPVNGIRIEPSKVTINQNVVQSGGYREVAVVVETTGNLARGYRITNITVFPRTVTLFSNNPEVVSELPGFISTLPFDLSDAKDDLEARIGLDLPEEVILVGEEQSVLVQVGIAAIESGITITVPVEVINLDPNLKAAVSPEFVNVFLFGSLSVLDELSQEDVRIFVNLLDLEIGSHLVTPQAEILPEGIIVDAIAPDAIQVEITELKDN